MPSRPLPPSPAPTPTPLPHLYQSSLLLTTAAASSALVILFFVLLFLYFYFSLRYRRRSPTFPFDFATPSPSPSPAELRPYSYRDLRSATSNFDPSRLLGRGASASVFRGLLPSSPAKSVAVKSVSLSPLSDLEFKNELHVLSSLRPSPFVVSLLGYCSGHRDRRRLLVYEYMPNGSLQEALFGGNPQFDLDWEQRFRIILDIARGLKFLHLECEPPVVHGDIKPSNVLLGTQLRAKIADFGLARIKASTEADPLAAPDGFSQDLGIYPSQELYSSVSPEFEFEFATRVGGSNSCSDFEGRVRCNPSYENEIRAKGKEEAVAPLDDEGFSVENSKELTDGDWWWKQEGSGELSSRDYVREWIGSQICPRSNPDWENAERKSDLDETQVTKTSCVDAEKNNSARKHADSGSKKSGIVKEWWKEEYFAEMSKKNKCNKGLILNLFRKSSASSSSSHAHGSNSNIDRELNAPDVSSRKGGWRRKKRRSKSVASEIFSGDLFSRELSSTATSMRGTICYVAPEHGGCGQFMEKADIYSFGVLILVIVSGRRPLHVLSSPMKLERANLISWCRQLASSGNVLDLVDERLRDSFDKEQANLCINLALLCLQKLPGLRPDSGEIVKILKGEMDLPVVPFQFSPSPNSKMLNKSRRKKATHDPE